MAALIPIVVLTGILVTFVVSSVREAVGDSGGSASLAAGTTVPASSSSVRYVPGRVLVKFQAGTPPSVVDAVLASAGAGSQGAIGRIGAHVVGVSGGRREAALAALKASPAVEYAERDVVVERLDVVPNDPRWGSQWGPRTIGAPAAWEIARGSPSVVVAVLDTGVDSSHPDLQGALVPGYDVVNGDADPGDDQGHGTSAAGILAARTNNRVGVAGICWECAVMPVKVLDSTGAGTSSGVAQGIVWAVDHGARVISMSLGGPGTTLTLTDAIAYAVRKGVLIVAAAGNNGSTTRFYPAAYPEVLSVAGSDDADRLYSWSNYGSWVRVAAPGCNTTTTLGGGYGTFCGTSSATPIVAGLVGLAVAARPDTTKGEIEDAVQRTGVAIGTAVQGGRVDALSALSALGAQPPGPAPSEGGPIAPANTGLPTISGTAAVGQTLTSQPGTWSGTEPFTFSYQWLRCTSTCSEITGATARNYTVSPADADRRIRVRVAAKNAAGSSSARSNATGLVVLPSPANTSLPAIAGTPKVGQFLRIRTGSWANSPTGFTYQWRRCDVSGVSCTNIDGATRQRYLLTSSERGFTIRAAVTALNSGGSESATSAATPTVRPATTARYTGTVSRISPRRVFSRSLPRGRTVPRLTFGKAPSLTLAILDAKGRRVARTSGGSPLRLVRTLRKGTHRFVVKTKGARASFILTVVY